MPRSLMLPAAIAASAFAAIGLLSLSPLGEVFLTLRGEAENGSVVAVVSHGKTELTITAAQASQATELRFSLGNRESDVTLYVPPSWRFAEVRGLPTAAIAQAMHEDLTSYVVPACHEQRGTSDESTCPVADLHFLAPSTSLLHFTHVGSTPLLLELVTLDLATRAVARSAHIVAGSEELPLTP